MNLQLKLVIFALSAGLIASKAVNSQKPTNGPTCQKYYGVFQHCFKNLLGCLGAKSQTADECVRGMKYCAIACIAKPVCSFANKNECFNNGYNFVTLEYAKILRRDHPKIGGHLFTFQTKCKPNGVLDIKCTTGLVVAMKNDLDNYDSSLQDKVSNQFNVCFGSLYQCKLDYDTDKDATKLETCANQMIDCALQNTLTNLIIKILGYYPVTIRDGLISYIACRADKDSVKCAKEKLGKIGKDIKTAKCPTF